MLYPYNGTLFSPKKEWLGTMWMNLENIMLSERNQTQKATYCTIPFIWNVQNRQTYRNREYWLVDARGWGREEVIIKGNEREFLVTVKYFCHLIVAVNIWIYVWLFAALWTVAYQAPVSMGFWRQEYWSGLPFPSPLDLSDPGIKPVFSWITGRFFTTELPGKPIWIYTYSKFQKTLYTHPPKPFILYDQFRH